MVIGQIDVPEISLSVYNTLKKSGSRTEYSLILNDELRHLGSSITTMPLRYASLVHAIPGNEDQDFHSDSSTGERALIYLTDVIEESNGPIEFKNFGKVLGPAGTFVHYSANETHRGCRSDINRVALAMAFDTMPKDIKTIGAMDCVYWECPAGSTKKNPVPSGESPSNEYCCNKKSSLLPFVVAAIFLIIFRLLFMLR